MLVAAAVGAWGLHAYPSRRDDPFLGLIELRSPAVFHVLVYGYATLWFTTPFFALSHRLVARHDRRVYRVSPRRRTRGPAAVSRHRSDGRRRRSCSGETHFETTSGPRAGADMAHDPAARALHGRDDSRRGRHRQDVGLHVSLRRPAPPLASRQIRIGKIGGLVLEVKGDFCQQVRGILDRAGRERDYLEIGSTPASATTRCTTISIRTRSPLRSPHC